MARSRITDEPTSRATPSGGPASLSAITSPRLTDLESRAVAEESVSRAPVACPPPLSSEQVLTERDVAGREEIAKVAGQPECVRIGLSRLPVESHRTGSPPGSDGISSSPLCAAAWVTRGAWSARHPEGGGGVLPAKLGRHRRYVRDRGIHHKRDLRPGGGDVHQRVKVEAARGKGEGRTRGKDHPRRGDRYGDRSAGARTARAAPGGRGAGRADSTSSAASNRAGLGRDAARRIHQLAKRIPQLARCKCPAGEAARSQRLGVVADMTGREAVDHHRAATQAGLQARDPARGVHQHVRRGEQIAHAVAEAEDADVRIAGEGRLQLRTYALVATRDADHERRGDGACRGHGLPEVPDPPATARNDDHRPPEGQRQVAASGLSLCAS